MLKNKNNNKNAFTWFELVVVILIIAVLALILIPTFRTLIRNSSVSKDTQLINNLNQALDKDGKVHYNMTQALECAEDYGYNITKINATGFNNEILWDQIHDEFVYFNAQIKDVEYIDSMVPTNEQLSANDPSEVYYLWKICDKVPERQYSLYWTGKVSELPETISYGLDCGNCEDPFDITYLGDKELSRNVIIRTNSFESTLTINAPLDTVRHYGKLKQANIIAVAYHSYIEDGETGLVAVDTGNIHLTNDSNVTAVFFKAIDTNDNQLKDTFQDIKITLDKDAPLPTFYRDSVEIETNGTLVCEVEKEVENAETETEFIWLLKQGVYEQIKVSETSEQPETWVDLSDANQDTKDISWDIANNYDKGNVTLNSETRDFELNDGQKIEEVVTDNGMNQKTVEQTVEVMLNVKANVTEYTPTTADLIDIIVNNDYATQAALDKAYTFNAWTEEEQALIDLFIGAKVDGKNIFTNHIDTYLNQTKIQQAYDVVEAQYGASVVQQIKNLYAGKQTYLSWNADFEVSFDGDIEIGSVVLGGYYYTFATEFYNNLWVGFGVSKVDEDKQITKLYANETIRLLESAYNYTKNPDFYMNYAAICGYVQEFKCGVANLSDANIGKTITVKLYLYETDASGVETGNKIECGSYKYTLQAVSAVNQALITK